MLNVFPEGKGGGGVGGGVWLAGRVPIIGALCIKGGRRLESIDSGSVLA